MKSLLAQNPELQVPEKCGIKRKEIVRTYFKDGRVYTMVVRDTVAPEDPYLVLVKAGAFAIQNQEPYMGRLVQRALKDFLIKNNLEVNR